MSDQDRFKGTIGDEYDLFALSVPHHDELQDTVVATLVSAQPDSPERVIVELGAGDGITLGRLVDEYKDARIIAVDVDGPMLARAREVVGCEERVAYVEEDMLKALQGMEDASVDAVVSVYTIHNVDGSYRSQLFQEIGRVVRPGGVFVGGDKYAQDDEQEHVQALKAQLKAFDVYDEIGRSDLKEEWTKHYQEDDLVRFTEKEQEEQFAAGGFIQVKWRYRKGMEAVVSAKRS